MSWRCLRRVVVVRVVVGTLVVSHSCANSGKKSATNTARDGCCAERVRLGANVGRGADRNVRTGSEMRAPCAVCTRSMPICWRTCSDTFACSTSASVSANALLCPIDATSAVTANVRRGCRFAGAKRVAILSAHSIHTAKPVGD